MRPETTAMNVRAMIFMSSHSDHCGHSRDPLPPAFDAVARAGFAAVARNLSETRETGLYLVTARVGVDHRGESLVMFGQMRAWTYERHLALENIDELRQFVEAGAAQIQPTRVTRGSPAVACWPRP